MTLLHDEQTCLICKDEHKYVDQWIFEDSKSAEKIMLALEVEDRPEAGREILEIIKNRFHEFYFANHEKDVEERFEECLKQINVELLKWKKENAKDSLKINAVLGIISDDLLLLTQTGQAEAYLLRQGKLNVISDGASPFNKKELFSSVASGELAGKDQLIFSTARLLRFFSSSQLVALTNNTHVEFIEQLQIAAEANGQGLLSLISLIVKQGKSMQEFPTHKNKKRDFSLSFLLDKIGLVKNKILNLRNYRKDKVDKKALFIGITVIVALLIVSVILLSSSLGQQKDLEVFKAILEEMDTNIKQAQTYKMQGELDKANEILTTVEADLKKVINANVFREEVGEKSDLLRRTKESVNNIVRVSPSEKLIDLTQKRTSVSAKSLEFFKDTLYAVDQNALYKTILNVVESPLTISDTETVLSAVSMPDKNVVVFYTDKGRIIEYKNESFVIADTQDAGWQSAVDLGVFKKYLYLLDPGSNQIWKYGRLNDGYASAQKYVKDQIDISKAISLAIDGSVFVLNEGGEIIELYAGQKKDFIVKDLPSEILDQASKIFTLIDQKNLYVLDSLNNRVVVIEKGGTSKPSRYQKQYVFDKISPIQDLYVNEVEQKMYLLTAQELYEINLQAVENEL